MSARHAPLAPLSPVSLAPARLARAAVLAPPSPPSDPHALPAPFAAGQAASGDGAAASCANCGGAVLRAFCADCGQRVRTERITLRGLGRDLVTRVFSLDGTFARTLRRVVLDPGGLARDYVAGRRKQYVHPLTFLFLIIAAQYLVLTFHGDIMVQRLIETYDTIYADMGLLTQEQNDKMFDEMYGGIEAFSEGVWNAMKSYNSYVLVLQALAIASVLRFLSGSRYTLGETTAMVVWTFGGAISITMFVFAFGVPFVPFMPLSLGIAGIMMGYLAFAARRFYEPTWRYALLGPISYVLGNVLIMMFLVAVSTAVGVLLGWAGFFG